MEERRKGGKENVGENEEGRNLRMSKAGKEGLFNRLML